jgi:transcriptional regulator with XRE-family HTH domain
VALRIKIERLRRKWTQTDLGARSGLSASDISRIETGRLRPYPGQAARLAKALKVAPEDLLEHVEAKAS